MTTTYCDKCGCEVKASTDKAPNLRLLHWCNVSSRDKELRLELCEQCADEAIAAVSAWVGRE